MPAHDAGLTILPKKKKKTLKVTKLTSCMNFRMIQAVIKCFERSTVERTEENSNVSRCLFIRCKYGNCEMRNKKLINRRNDITQGWQFCSPLISPWKRKGKKKEKKIITTRSIRSRSPSQVLPAANRASLC